MTTRMIRMARCYCFWKDNYYTVAIPASTRRLNSLDIPKQAYAIEFYDSAQIIRGDKSSVFSARLNVTPLLYFGGNEISVETAKVIRPNSKWQRVAPQSENVKPLLTKLNVVVPFRPEIDVII